MLLHRSEGFGLPLAEAMAQGLPVVATNWSGNTDFMDFDNSCPVSYCLVPARDPQGSYDHADQLWAEPSAANAAMHLRRLRENPAFGAELGRAASLTIRERCSPRRSPTLGRAADGRCRHVLKTCPECVLKECLAAANGVPPSYVVPHLIGMVHCTLRALDNEMLFRSYSRRLIE